MNDLLGQMLHAVFKRPVPKRCAQFVRPLHLLIRQG